MLKQLDNMLGTSASKHSIDADEAAPLDVDPDLVLRAHVAREGEENVDEQLDALTPADQLRMADMEEAFEWFEAKEEENTPEAVKAEREEQRHRKALQALQRTPFKTYSKGLELFLSSYVEFGDLGYDLNNAARNNEAFSLGSLPEGKYHWTDDRYEDGVILIKVRDFVFFFFFFFFLFLFFFYDANHQVREEKRGEYNDPELAGLGVGPAQGRGVDRICRQGLMIDLGRRKLHAVEYWECGDEDMSEKERWQVKKRKRRKIFFFQCPVCCFCAGFRYSKQLVDCAQTSKMARAVGRQGRASHFSSFRCNY